MREQKRGVIALIAIIGFSLIISGCSMSKSKYESRVKAILKNIEDQSRPIQDEMKKIGSEKNKSISAKLADLNNKQIDILERGKADLESISPPDDFFNGHSDLVEFFELLIKASEQTFPASGDGQQVDSQQDTLEILGAGTNAFSKATKELPFLEFELKQAFGDIMNRVQDNVFKQQTLSPAE